MRCGSPAKAQAACQASADGQPEVRAQCTLEVVQCKLEMEMIGPDEIYYGRGERIPIDLAAARRAA